jgi:hypothetical protein
METFYKVGAKKLETGNVEFYNGTEDGYAEMSTFPSIRHSYSERETAEKKIHGIIGRISHTFKDGTYGEPRVYEVTFTYK